MADIQEHWQRGPIPGIDPLLQPVAHCLLQVRDEVKDILDGFRDEQIWLKPSGSASVGFHLQHLRGVLDRLFTYARSESLTNDQLLQLRVEGLEVDVSLSSLLQAFERQIASSMEQLKNTRGDSLTEERFLGRVRISTTTIGLLFHAAEHSMRHTGQLLVTVRWLKSLA